MIPLHLDRGGTEGLQVLCLGAHCDDIEIGCGGTILRLAEEQAIDELKWVVFTSNPTRAEEAKRSADSFLSHVSKKEIEIMSFRDGFLFNSAAEVKTTFEEIKKGFDPDIVFTHARGDLHQDHRTVSELTGNAFRDHLVLEYEIPKYDGDLGTPNVLVALDAQPGSSIVVFGAGAVGLAAVMAAFATRLSPCLAI